jgi:hypothetical protein
MPIGDEYSRVHSPFVGNNAAIKAGINHSYGPLIYKQLHGDIEYGIQNLTNYGLSATKTFGKGSIKPYVVGQAAMETNFGNVEQQSLLQHKAVIGGLSFHEEGKGKSSVGVIKGTGFHSRDSSTGLLVTFGLNKENWGMAGSAVMEDVGSTDSAIKLTGGMYMSRNKTRLMIEYDKQLDKVYNPDEISVGLRKTIVKNKRDINIISSISYGLSNMPGSAPRFDIAVSFNLNKNKQEEEPEEELVAEEKIEETVEQPEEPTEVESEEEELFIITEPKGKELEKPEVKSTPPRRSSRQKSTRTEDNKMPDNSNNTTAYESQPDPTLESINHIAQTTGGDSSVSLLLAMMAVVGGGAAWKFYTQYSEQKHEQKMKQLELDAQAAGLAGAQPPPCQAAKVKLEAELQEVKTKLESLDRKVAFTADFDADLLERRMKKLERKLQDMEEE